MTTSNITKHVIPDASEAAYVSRLAFNSETGQWAAFVAFDHLDGFTAEKYIGTGQTRRDAEKLVRAHVTPIIRLVSRITAAYVQGALDQAEYRNAATRQSYAA